MSRGELFILSAPSGTGKTTLIRSLLRGDLGDFSDIAFSVSHTTRQRREGEVDGRHYHFVDEEEFRGMIAEDRFLEWAEVYGNYYGTSIDEIEPQLSRGLDVLMDVDVQGAERVMNLLADPDRSPIRAPLNSIFIMPPGYADLERRLSRRQLDDPEAIERRLAVSHSEIAQVDRYDYVIVNDDAERASHVLASIILANRHRRARMQPQVERVLDDFRRAQRARAEAGAVPEKSTGS
jgi:guanylate kinase